MVITVFSSYLVQTDMINIPLKWKFFTPDRKCIDSTTQVQTQIIPYAFLLHLKVW